MSLQRVKSLEDQPDFVSAFAQCVANSQGKVCLVCGLERMGHSPQSSWLGYERHDWQPVDATDDELNNARALTRLAYAKRGTE